MDELDLTEDGAPGLPMSDNSSIVHNQESSGVQKKEKLNQVLSGLPKEIKLVIQDKMKSLKTEKVPIILQPDIRPVVPKPVRNVSSQMYQNHIPTLEQRTVVQKNAKDTIKPQAQNNLYTSAIYYSSHPKGVPKSFLLQQTPGPVESPVEKQVYDTTSIRNPPMDIASEIPEWVLFPSEQSQVTEAGPSNTNADVNCPVPGGSYSSTGDFTSDDIEGDQTELGQKRLSAFERLGPLTQPKKPKLTINLLFSKEQSVREVVNEKIQNDDEEDLTPVLTRKEVLSSTDETVIRILPFWPWKVGVVTNRTVMPKDSKSAMLMEQEQISDGYGSSYYTKVEIKDCPKKLKRQFILDLLLEKVRDNSFIPCFIERSENSLTFLVIKNRSGLLALHKIGLKLQYDNSYMPIHISLTNTSIQNLNFLPKLVLRKKLLECVNETSLNLKAFCLSPDFAHFIYFPLHREFNQIELVQLNAFEWKNLVNLDLSCNKITTIDGFCLAKTTPKLKNLNLADNCIERMASLVSCRGLSLHSLSLEGNPLCHDYRDPDLYVKTAKMLFPGLHTLDGENIRAGSSLPEIKQNYCPPDAVGIVNKFLETFFPLMDLPPEDRNQMDELYFKDAVLTITHRYKLHTSSVYRYFRELFSRSRCLEEGNMDSVCGASAIVKRFMRWPPLKHDPTTFHVDVLNHDDSMTILRVMGVTKMTSDSLAEDEALLSFTRTFVICCDDQSRYRIHSDMLYWDEPTAEFADIAFQCTSTVATNQLSVKQETNPSNELKNNLMAVFMEITNQPKTAAEKCLTSKTWDLRAALEYFMNLVKLGGTEILQ